MRAVLLPGSDITTTALGFGCAHLLRIPDRRGRRRLLEAAYEAGIRHFDVARMYGLGASEAELGRFARSRRDELFIATKFGIEPAPLARAVAPAQRPIRALLRVAPGLRKVARRRADRFHARRRFDAPAVRNSLTKSLRMLGTDHVDLFLVHEPSPDELPAAEVAECLEDERRAGRVRTWGLAGEAESTLQCARMFAAGVPVVQVPDDALRRTRPPTPQEARARVTFAPFATALPAIIRHVAAHAERRRVWSAAAGVDCGDPEALASLLLRYAGRSNSSGVVLFSTGRPERVAAAAQAVARDPQAADPGLDAFLALVAEELGARPAVQA